MESTEALALTTIQDIAQSAPLALEQNKNSHEKALAYGKSLLEEARAGMTDELDQKINNYLFRLKETEKLMKERRMPVTQLFDEIKKQFTELEAEISSTGKANVYADLQKMRNDYLAEKIRKQREQEELARLKVEKDKERILVTQQMEVNLHTSFNNYISMAKEQLNNLFYSISLSNANDTKTQIAAFPEAYPFSHFDGVNNMVRTAYLTLDEIKVAVINAKAGLYDKQNAECIGIIKNLKRDLLEKIPSRTRELEEMAMADEAQRKSMEAAAEQRRKEEEDKARKEAAEAEQRAKEDAESKASAEVANTLFDAQVTVLESQVSQQMRTGFDIEVLNPVGWSLIFQFWFQKEGMKLPQDKIEKKTMGSMKTFCEGWAHKNGEKIESQYISYKESFKAITTRQ